MAIDDSAVLVPGVGHIFTNPTSGVKWTYSDVTAFATSATIKTGFSELGHTDLDTIMTFAQDGGDTATKGSWQNPSLRTVITSAVVDSFTVNAEQVIDNDVLSLYYGGGDVTGTDEFGLPDAPAALERSVTVVFLDGSTPVGFSVPKASILRGDVPQLASDDFVKLPLKFTLLKATSLHRAYWLGAGLGA